MYVERPMKDALRDYLKGRKVLVITEYDDGSISADNLEDILVEDDSHYLVDVPAVEKPDFGQAVQEMARSVPSPEQIIEAVHETQDDSGIGISVIDTSDTDISDMGTRIVPCQEDTEESDDVESNTPPETPERLEEEKDVRMGQAVPENKENKKSTAEIVAELSGQGLTAKQISEQTGIKYDTVYYHYRKLSDARTDKQVSHAGVNADRHLCRTCRYQSSKPNVNGCDYSDIVKHSRGCPVEDCNVYVEGARLKVKS